MENSEILGLQLSLPRRFSLIQVQEKVEKLVHKLILYACVSTVVKSITKECLCYHELNAGEYFKLKQLHFYFLPILQIFFSKLINKRAIINLFLIHDTKRQKVFSYIFYTIFNKKRYTLEQSR